MPWEDAFDEISFTFWLEAIYVPGHLGRAILDWCKDMRLELKVQGVSSLTSTPKNSKWFLSKCRTGPRLPRKHTSNRVPSGPFGSSLAQCFGSVGALVPVALQMKAIILLPSNRDLERVARTIPQTNVKLLSSLPAQTQKKKSPGLKKKSLPVMLPRPKS